MRMFIIPIRDYFALYLLEYNEAVYLVKHLIPEIRTENLLNSSEIGTETVNHSMLEIITSSNSSMYSISRSL